VEKIKRTGIERYISKKLSDRGSRATESKYEAVAETGRLFKNPYEKVSTGGLCL
jgi:hypothetical protein